MAGKILTSDAEARVAADLGMDSEDVQRLQDDIKVAQQDEPACTSMMPDIRIATQILDGEQHEVAYWHETNGKDNDGTPQVWQLPSTVCALSAQVIHAAPGQPGREGRGWYPLW